MSGSGSGAVRRLLAGPVALAAPTRREQVAALVFTPGDLGGRTACSRRSSIR
ncbi:hypothetical protein ACIGXI_39200 [Kitasatospora aureofaciens]|uniref:hypothetical protein n=1 Tax=Kitasatospora aureofaciens TaxID=1894 RepID=UPI0037C77E4D